MSSNAFPRGLRSPRNWLLVALLGVSTVWTTAVAGPSPEGYEELRKAYEATAGQPPVERLPALQALGACEDPRAGQYLGEILKKGGKDQLGLLEVTTRILGERGDAQALEAVVVNAFRVLPERRWKLVGEAFIGHLEPDAVTWITEKGYKGIPKLPPTAQRVVVEILHSTGDSRAGDAAKRLLGNRKCSPELQAMFVDLLRLHRVEGAAKSIARMFRYDSATLQVAVLKALRELNAEEHSKVFHEGLESRHWETRVLAADIFGGTHDPAIIPALIPLLDDAFPEVQIAAVQALRTIGGREVVEPLIEALETAPGRVRDDIADTLLWLLGEDLGTEAISWESWWKIHGADAEVKGITREEYDRIREESANAATGTYYGLRVISTYVTFIIDVSGSMEEPYLAEVREPGKDGERGGTTVGGGRKGKDRKKRAQRRKIEVAREELSRALNGLKNGTQFNLIPFDSQVQRWQPALIEMSDEIREDALAYVGNLNPGGMTNIYDTLMTALEDEQVNTIYFLSDGAPTNGIITDPDEILRRVVEANELRKVKIHTIGFHLDPVAEKLMRQLAEQNYGSFVKK